MSRPAQVLPYQPSTMSTAQLAAVSYLARYSGRTHVLYAFQLRQWFTWCETNALDPLVGIQRAHVELYIRQLGDHGFMDSSVVTMMHAVRGTSGSPTSTASSAPTPPSMHGQSASASRFHVPSPRMGEAGVGRWAGEAEARPARRLQPRRGDRAGTPIHHRRSRCQEGPARGDHSRQGLGAAEKTCCGSWTAQTSRRSTTGSKRLAQLLPGLRPLPLEVGDRIPRGGRHSSGVRAHTLTGLPVGERSGSA